MPPRDEENHTVTEAAIVPTGPGRVLMVSPTDEIAAGLRDSLPAGEYAVTPTDSIANAFEHLAEETIDVALVDRRCVGAFEGDDLLDELRAVADIGSTKLVLVTIDGTFNDAVAAVRAGFFDILAWPGTGREAALRVSRAVDEARHERFRRRRMRRLRSACRKLNRARREASHQVDVLCRDLVDAYQEMADQVDEATMTAEYRTLATQELDVEELLRTTLEYLLTKTGPTNAAVFLPNEEGEFGLGAYVNYDCPRQSVSTLLDHLCQAICPQMASEHETIMFRDAAEFAEWIGIQDAGFLASSQVVAYACHHEGECLAVVVLFRNERDPFEENLAQVIEVLRPIFASQLARIVRIHQRGRAEWPEDAHAGEDDLDDDLDFGCNGGMAA